MGYFGYADLCWAGIANGSALYSCAMSIARAGIKPLGIINGGLQCRAPWCQTRGARHNTGHCRAGCFVAARSESIRLAWPRGDPGLGGPGPLGRGQTPLQPPEAAGGRAYNKRGSRDAGAASKRACGSAGKYPGCRWLRGFGGFLAAMNGAHCQRRCGANFK